MPRLYIGDCFCNFSALIGWFVFILFAHKKNCFCFPGLFALFCGPCFMCKLATSVQEHYCGPLCCGVIFTTALRTRVRTMYGIKVCNLISFEFEFWGRIQWEQKLHSVFCSAARLIQQLPSRAALWHQATTTVLARDNIQLNWNWTGLDWDRNRTEPDRTGPTGLDRTGPDWTGPDWTGLDWTGLDWTEAKRSEVHCYSLVCVQCSIIKINITKYNICKYN